MRKLHCKAIITLAFFIVSLSVTGQQLRNLEGYVTDKDGKPVSGVSVNPKGMDQTVLTDENGYFLLQSVHDSILTWKQPVLRSGCTIELMSA